MGIYYTHGCRVQQLEEPDSLILKGCKITAGTTPKRKASSRNGLKLNEVLLVEWLTMHGCEGSTHSELAECRATLDGPRLVHT